ncbi:hypothetical protein KR084_004520, partial [Drosophila pseudotakahashii]
MESRVASSAGQPDTIMIQLVSQQPTSSGQMQARPISVRAIPLFPGTRTSSEKPRRPVTICPNMRAPADHLPRMHSKIRPEMCAPPKRKPSQNQFRCSSHRYSSSGISQPPPLCYVFRPEDRIVPIYVPPPGNQPSKPFSNEQGGRTGKECPCCGRVLIQESHAHRDQGTNTIPNEQPDLGDLKMICETLGRAMVSAAVEAVQKSQPAEPPNGSVTDSKEPRNIILKILSQLGELEPVSGESRNSGDLPAAYKRKPSFSETVRLSTVPSDTSGDEMPLAEVVEYKMPSEVPDPVEYPKTPRPTPELKRGSGNSPCIISPKSSRLISGSLRNEGKRASPVPP